MRTHARIAAAVESPLREALTDAIQMRRNAEAEITYADAEALVARARSRVSSALDEIRRIS